MQTRQLMRSPLQIPRPTVASGLSLRMAILACLLVCALQALANSECTPIDSISTIRWLNLPRTRWRAWRTSRIMVLPVAAASGDSQFPPPRTTSRLLERESARMLIFTSLFIARVAELADAPDSKSGGRKAVWVRFPPRAPLVLSAVCDFSRGRLDGAPLLGHCRNAFIRRLINRGFLFIASRSSSGTRALR
jgi:hypothetical protein